MKQVLPRILLVEDEPEVRFELKRFLQRYAKEVITANNGEEGLSLYTNHLPEIVITDIKMPRMSGIEMAKKIKSQAPEQAIIFTTAHNDNEYFLEAIELQVDGYIPKPVDLGVLKRKIQHVTQRIEINKQKKFYENILNDIAQMQGTMLAVYDEMGTPLFYNKKLLDFLGVETLDDFKSRYVSLSSMFEAKSKYYHPYASDKDWIEETVQLPQEQRVVSLREAKSNISKVFQVLISTQTSSNNIIVTFSEVTSLMEKKDQYMHEAYTDELTKIPNRAKFNLYFERVLREAEKKHNENILVLMDLDNFKQINDRYGHMVGDAVLQEFSRLVLSNIRAKDFFARWGGEEFILLLEDTSLEHAIGITEHLRKIVEKHDFEIDQTITCSFGLVSAKEGVGAEQLFHKADNALYQAKNSGRNKLVVYQSK